MLLTSKILQRLLPTVMLIFGYILNTSTCGFPIMDIYRWNLWPVRKTSFTNVIGGTSRYVRCCVPAGSCLDNNTLTNSNNGDWCWTLIWLHGVGVRVPLLAGGTYDAKGFGGTCPALAGRISDALWKGSPADCPWLHGSLWIWSRQLATGISWWRAGPVRIGWGCGELPLAVGGGMAAEPHSWRCTNSAISAFRLTRDVLASIATACRIPIPIWVTHLVSWLDSICGWYYIASR